MSQAAKTNATKDKISLIKLLSEFCFSCISGISWLFVYQKKITAIKVIIKIMEELMLNGSIAIIVHTNKLEINRISKFLLMDWG